MKSRFATSAAPRPATNSSNDKTRSPLRSAFLNATNRASEISGSGSSANNPFALLTATTKTIATHTDRLTNHVDPSITNLPQESGTEATYPHGESVLNTKLASTRSPVNERCKPSLVAPGV